MNNFNNKGTPMQIQEYSLKDLFDTILKKYFNIHNITLRELVFFNSSISKVYIVFILE
jgi:hypothetical protein